MPACTLCGAIPETSTEPGAEPGGSEAAAEAGAMPPGWSATFTERGVLWQCARCVRDNIRSIEAKLPEEYWE